MKRANCEAWARLLTVGLMTCGMASGCWPPQPSSTPPQTTVPESPAVPALNAAAVPTPDLDLHIAIPPEVPVHTQFTATLQITNRGQTPASGLVVYQVAPAEFEQLQWRGPSPQELARLKPGETAEAEVVFRAQRPGTFAYRVELHTRGATIASAETSVLVKPDGQPQPQPQPPGDLGPPLVEDPERLERLHPTYPVWIDKKNRAVVMLGEVCQREVPLELFACTKDSKEHESVVVVNTKAYVVHAGLLAVGAEPGTPVQFSPEFTPARGTEIDVTAVYKDEQGEIRRVRAQEWICHVETGKPMEYPWVFAGSRMLKDEETGRQYYQADGEGDLICVSNFPSAVLDIPVQSSADSGALLFKANPEKVPPRGTPVTVILTPRLQPKEPTPQPQPAQSSQPEGS